MIMITFKYEIITRLCVTYLWLACIRDNEIESDEYD